MKALGVLLSAVLLAGCGTRTVFQEGAARRGECVVLLHGLWRGAWMMAPLARRLHAAGYSVLNVDYPSRAAPIETLAERHLAPAVARHCAGRRMHFVTHSMGALLVRAYLAGRPAARVGRLILIAPPNRGSALVDRFGAWPLVGAALGPAGRQLSSAADAPPRRLGPLPAPAVVLAGTASFNPLFSALLAGPDDGRVAVTETRIEGVVRVETFPCDHDGLVCCPGLAERVLALLAADDWRPGQESNLRPSP
ncbi:MAG: acetyltransferase [Gammaproteobacteria bacterium]|nr:MAG: acetyltransferase [Gammaproteobacteria bacterium]